MERNEDRVVLDQIRELRSQYTDIHVFYGKLDELSDKCLCQFSKEWMDDVYKLLKFCIKVTLYEEFQEAKHYGVIRPNEESDQRRKHSE